MKKLLCIAALIGLFAACGGGDNGGTETDGDPARTDAADATDAGGAGAGATPDVEEAEEGTANVPQAGTYLYDYETEVTNAATPDATPRRSRPDAELTSKVSVDGGDVTIADKSTEGPAVATVERRYTDDGIVEISFETKAPQGTSSCTYTDPIELLPFPIEEQELDAQSMAGEGNQCQGEREITIEGTETIRDAQGTSWDTWHVRSVTTIRTTVGITNRQTVDSWFSPDLGREIKIEGVSESINAEKQVVARGESKQLLKSHPS